MSTIKFCENCGIIVDELFVSPEGKFICKDCLDEIEEKLEKED